MANRTACLKLKQFLIGAIIALQFMPMAFAGEAITNEKLQEMLTHAGLSGRLNGTSDATSQNVTQEPIEPSRIQAQVQPQLQPASTRICREDELAALLGACRFGNLSEVQGWLDKGCDVNATFEDGVTFLIVAAAYNQEQIAKLLLERGAAIDRADTRDGRSDSTALATAARKGHVSVAKLLLDGGANPNVKNSMGRTPLMTAIVGGHLEMVKLLVQRGSDVNVAEPNGYRALDLALSAFDLASSAGNGEMVTTLRNAGGVADPKVEARFGGRVQAASAPQSFNSSIPADVLARIKADIASRYPNSYSTQEMLLKANVESWQRLQRNFSDVPDSVFLQIRNNIASRYPDSYSTQETLVKAEIESWKKLNGR